MSAILNIQDLSIGHKHKVLLSNISLTVMPGEIIAIVGRNGTGKTTLLKTICGLLEPLSGNILFRDEPLSALSPLQRAQRISIVLTQRVLLHGISVKQLVEMGRYPSAGRYHFSNKKDHALIESCMEKMHITRLAAKPLSEISDGELQKTMIARALAQQTPVILMDEPTAFLDYVAKDELFDLLRDLVASEKISILFSSHDLELVRKYADRTLKVGD